MAGLKLWAQSDEERWPCQGVQQRAGPSTVALYCDATGPLELGGVGSEDECPEPREGQLDGRVRLAVWGRVDLAGGDVDANRLVAQAHFIAAVGLARNRGC